MKSRIILFIVAVWIGCLSSARAILMYPLTVTNIAELKSLSITFVQGEEETGTTPIPNPEVYVAGYYAPDDRGGGAFMWDPNSGATPDDGHYIFPNGWSGNGRWIRQLNGEVANVKMWGAKGNGVTDDTVAVQNAMTAMSLQQTWTEEILFPSGTYSLSNTIVFDGWFHVRGEGDNANNTQIVMHGDHDVFRTQNAQNALSGSAYDFDHGVIFESMSILMDTNATSNAGLVLCNPGEGSTIRNLIINWGGYGIRTFGAGAPGLQICDVQTGNPYVAGVCVEGNLPNGNTNGYLDDGGGISLFRLSGDHARPDSDATASLVLINHCAAHCSVYDFKAEQSWGGGLFNYQRSLGTTNADWYQIGTLDIQGGSYDCGSPNCDFVVLGSDQNKTAAVSIHSVRLIGIRHLIRDDMTPRNIDPDLYDTANSAALDQALCRLPLQYEGEIGLSRCIINGSDTVAFVPTTTNAWYRILFNPSGFCTGGRLIVSDISDSSEANVDVDPTAGSSGALINVERAPAGSGTHYPPCVTKMRAGSYSDPSDGFVYSYVDIFVNRINALGGTEVDKIIVKYPFESQQGEWSFLTAPTSAYANDPTPPGDTLISCVTNSLTR